MWVLSYSPGTSEADKTCWLDDPFSSAYLTNNATCSRNPAEDTACCQSPEASTVTSSSMSLEQTGKEKKTNMLCQKERNTTDQCKKQGGPEREGKRKGMSQNRVWAGKTTQEEKKIQDKCYAQ